MIKAVAIISVTLLPLIVISMAGEVKGNNDSFYIWQRSWSSGKVAEEAKKMKCRRYYFLSCEFTASRIERITPPAEFYAIPGNVAIPVFRIHTSFFNAWIRERKKFTEKVLCEFRRLCRKHGSHFREVQIDLDSPVSKLNYYGEFLAAVKKELPAGTILSFTALPCHLRSKTFKKIAKFADYYVLQVHGLEVPKFFSDKVEILNIETANLAIEHAEKLGVPYFLALPTYAYQLNFDRENKKFLFLNAEKIPPQNSKVITKIVAPDFKNLASIITKERNNKLQSCKGVIWFRMPIPGDRYNLDAKTLSILQTGQIPVKKITAHWEKSSRGTATLIIENHGILENGTVHITIKWQKPHGIYDLFRSFSVEEHGNCNELPTSIVSTIPPPGKPTPVGWFRTDNKTTPAIKIETKMKHI